MAEENTLNKCCAVDSLHKAAEASADENPEIKKEELFDALDVIQTTVITKTSELEEKTNSPTATAAVQIHEKHKTEKNALANKTKSNFSASLQNPKIESVSIEENKNTMGPQKENPAQDVEMTLEGEEEAAPIQQSLEKLSKEVVHKHEDAEMSSSEKNEIKSKSVTAAAPKPKRKTNAAVDFELFVGGLRYDTTGPSFFRHFSQIGTVLKWSLPIHLNCKERNRGFGFVSFNSREATVKALSIAHTIDGRIIEVQKHQSKSSLATPKPPNKVKEKTPEKGSAVETYARATKAAAHQFPEIQKEDLFEWDKCTPCALGASPIPVITKVNLFEEEISNPGAATAALQIHKTVETKNITLTNESTSNPRASPQGPKIRMVFAKEAKTAKIPIQDYPAKGDEIAAEGEEEAARAQRLHKESSNKEAVRKSEDADMSAEEKFEGTSRPVEAAAPELKHETNKAGYFDIFVGGLRYDTRIDSFLSYFSQFGTVMKCTLPLKPMKRQNMGYGFISFNSREAVDKALAIVHTLDCRRIELRKNYIDSETVNQPFHPNELYVGGIRRYTQMCTLEQYFSKYGKVNNVALPFTACNNKNKGFAFVYFESAASLQNALEADHEIDGNKIRVFPDKKPDDKTLGVEKKEAKSKYGGSLHPNQLFARGIKMTTPKSTLEQHFSKYGEVTEVTLPLFKPFCKNEGYALVSFESAASLQRALGGDHEIDGKKIDVIRETNSEEICCIYEKAETIEDNTGFAAPQKEKDIVIEEEIEPKILYKEDCEKNEDEGASAVEAEGVTEEKVDGKEDDKADNDNAKVATT